MIFPSYSECEECYHFQDDPDGVYTCTECHHTFCKQHSIQHTSETNHHEFQHIEIPTNQSLLDESKNNVRGSMLAGFENLHNTCYFNSNLHVLFSISEFVNFCLSNECDKLGDLGHQLHRFVTAYHEGTRLFLRPSLLRKAIDVNAPQYLLPEPQDSIDFFNYLLSTLTQQLPVEKSHLDLVQFNLIDEITCHKCKQTFTVKNSNKQIPIQFTEQSNPPFHAFVVKPQQRPEDYIEQSAQLNLDQLIDERCDFFFSNDPKSIKTDDQSQRVKCMNFTCPHCGCHEGNMKRKIEKAPKYLYVNVRLDHGSRDPDQRRKLRALLQFDMNNFDISRHVHEGNGKYQLLSFMHHTGKWAKWGHDISYVRKEGSETLFVEFNDNVTREVNLQSYPFGRQYLYLFKQI